MMPRAHFPTDESYLEYLRDWFAGQALAGLVAYAPREKEHNSPAEFARFAYALANGMIAERNGPLEESLPDIDEYIQEYVFTTEGNDYVPTDWERELIADALAGWA